MRVTEDTTFAKEVSHLNPASEAVAMLTEHATIEFVTFTRLVRSKYNVRVKKTDLKELAASIRSIGLLQNLIGYWQLVDGVATGVIEVVAGDRRMQAIGTLIGAGELPEDFAIPVLIVTEDEAIEISLAENVNREDMHPADVYVAMQAMIDHGRAIADVALRFELAVPTVKRYLKLANVSPRLIGMYREGELTIEHMMAFALVDDHAAQEQAWDSLPANSRSPYYVRNLFTAQKINTQTDRVARYVGVVDYEKAGGVVMRDLFSNDNTGYISDVALLEKVATDKLQKHAKKLLKDGANWVEILLRPDYSDLSAFGRVRTVPSTLSNDDQQQVDALEEQLNALEEQMDAAGESEEEELYTQLVNSSEDLSAKRAAILATRTEVPSDEDKAIAGAVVYIDHAGAMQVKHDVIRPEDVAKRVSANTANTPAGKRAKPDHSDRLTSELTSHRTVALQAEMIDQTDVALVYLTFTLMKAVLLEHSGATRTTLAKISLTKATVTDAAKKSPAASAVAQRREQLLERLPSKNGEGWLEWLRTQPQPVVLEMLAFCAATSIDATQAREGASPDFVALGKALNLDMTKWWHATADAYFDHVPMARIVKVVSDAVSSEAAVPFENMKKKQAAEAAERAVADVRWLPELLRTE